jgi:hypothetical protein
MPSIGDSHHCQFCALALADAKLDAPTEDHAGRDIVAPANRRGADARLLSLHHDRKLLRVGEAAPVRPSVARRSSSRRVCQAVFDQLFVSSAASTTAYRRTDTRMKPRTPVDLQGCRIQASAPRAQAVHRDVVCYGVIFGTHAAPVQRLDVHRPERLDRLVALVTRHRLSRPLAPLACFLTRRFQRIQRTEPAVERALGQPMEPAIFGASDTASTPRVQVSCPPRPSCFVLEVSCPHRRSSHARRNPIWFANAPPNRCARPGRLQPTERWQDKSREVRGGRSVGKRAMIKDLARCAPAHDSLPIRTSHCRYRQEGTLALGT